MINIKLPYIKTLTPDENSNEYLFKQFNEKYLKLHLIIRIVSCLCFIVYSSLDLKKSYTFETLESIEYIKIGEKTNDGYLGILILNSIMFTVFLIEFVIIHFSFTHISIDMILQFDFFLANLYIFINTLTSLYTYQSLFILKCFFFFAFINSTLTIPNLFGKRNIIFFISLIEGLIIFFLLQFLNNYNKKSNPNKIFLEFIMFLGILALNYLITRIFDEIEISILSKDSDLMQSLSNEDSYEEIIQNMNSKFICFEGETLVYFNKSYKESIDKCYEFELNKADKLNRNNTRYTKNNAINRTSQEKRKSYIKNPIFDDNNENTDFNKMVTFRNEENFFLKSTTLRNEKYDNLKLSPIKNKTEYKYDMDDIEFKSNLFLKSLTKNTLTGINQNINLLEIIYEIITYNQDEEERDFTKLGVFNIQLPFKLIYEVYYRKFIHDEKYILEIMMNEVTEITESEKVFAEMKYKQKILSKIAHEFKTPLNSMLGISSSINETNEELYENISPFSDEQTQIITNHCVNIQKYNKLSTSLAHLIIYQVNDLIKYSENFDFGTKILDIVNINLKELLTFCFDILQSLIHCTGDLANKVKPILNINPSLENKVFKTDEVKLKQAIINLIVNAVKFTKFGSITLSAEPIDDLKLKDSFKLNCNSFIIKVIDTGCGFKDDFKDSLKKKLQEKFSNQIDDNDYMSSKGTGFGLFITNSVCKRLNYDFNFFSSFGNGSTFSIIVNEGYNTFEDIRNKIYGFEDIVKNFIHEPQEYYFDSNISKSCDMNLCKNILNKIYSKYFERENKIEDENNFIVPIEKINLIESSPKLKLNEQLKTDEDKIFGFVTSPSISLSKKKPVSKYLSNLNFKKNEILNEMDDEDLLKINEKSFNNKKSKLLENLENDSNENIDIYDVFKSQSVYSKGLNSPSYEFISEQNSRDLSDESEDQTKNINDNQNFNNLFLNFENEWKENNTKTNENESIISRNKHALKKINEYDSLPVNKYNSSSNTGDLKNVVSSDRNVMELFKKRFKLITKTVKEPKLSDRLSLVNNASSKSIKKIGLVIKTSNKHFKRMSKTINLLPKPSNDVVAETNDIIDKSNENINNVESSLKFKILVVDDSPEILKSTSNLVKKVIDKLNLDYEVISLTDGIETLKQIFDDQSKNLVKIILTDEHMQLMNGSESIKHIKRFYKDGKIKFDIKVASITCFNDEGTCNNLKLAGIEEVVNKPISLSRMESLLCNFISLIERSNS